MIKKHSYVRIRQTVLKPENRSTHLPEDTKKIPFKIWVKGYLMEDADLFDYVNIKTTLGQTFYGRLKEVNPPYKHSFGDFVPEILKIKDIIMQDNFGDYDE